MNFFAMLGRLTQIYPLFYRFINSLITLSEDPVVAAITTGVGQSYNRTIEIAEGIQEDGTLTEEARVLVKE